MSLGKWLRHSQDATSNISAWCKAHGVRQGTAEHMHLTVDMFMEREAVHDVKTLRKRKPEDEIVSSDKRRKGNLDSIDTKAPKKDSRQNNNQRDVGAVTD